jgi:hypothetical protein
MSQTTITSFFNSRKRAATDEIISSKSKIAHIDHALKSSIKPTSVTKKCEAPARLNSPIFEVIKKAEKPQESLNKLRSVEENKTAFSKKVNATNVKSVEHSKPASSNTIKSARKELSLGDLKKRLANSSRLAELRASADKISKGIQELKEASDKKNLKEFKSIDVEVFTR